MRVSANVKRAIEFVEKLNDREQEQFAAWFAATRPHHEPPHPAEYADHVTNSEVALTIATQAGAPELRSLVAMGVSSIRRRPVRAKEKRSLRLDRDWLTQVTFSRADGTRVTYAKATVADWQYRLSLLQAQQRGVASSVEFVSRVLSALTDLDAASLSELRDHELAQYELARAHDADEDEPSAISAR